MREKIQRNQIITNSVYINKQHDGIKQVQIYTTLKSENLTTLTIPFRF